MIRTNIYPNTTNGLVQIKGIDQPTEVCLYHTNGQLLSVWPNPGNEVMTNHPSGLYLMSIQKDDYVIYRKLIIE